MVYLLKMVNLSMAMLVITRFRGRASMSASAAPWPVWSAAPRASSFTAPMGPSSLRRSQLGCWWMLVDAGVLK